MHDITKYKLILISGEIHKLRPCNFTSPQIFPGLHLIGLGDWEVFSGERRSPITRSTLSLTSEISYPNVLYSIDSSRGEIRL